MCQILSRRPVPHAILIASIVIIADQISKWWLISRVLSNDVQTGFLSWLIQKGEQLRFPHIPLTDFFNLVMVWNKGISFGLFQKDSTIMPVILSVLALGITIGFLVWVRESTSRWMTFGTGLIIGGALGNVWDRVRFGAVADFFDFYIGSYHWPAFNIADSAITIGVVLLLIHLLQEKPAANVQS